MDFQDVIRDYPIKTMSKGPDGSPEEVNFAKAKAYLDANPDLFYQKIFSDGTVTTIELNPDRTEGADNYAILTAYHKDGGNISPNEEYSEAVMRATMPRLTQDAPITFSRMELSGYADKSMGVVVYGPENDYDVFIRPSLDQVHQAPIRRDFNLEVRNDDGTSIDSIVTTYTREEGDYSISLVNTGQADDGKPQYAATLRGLPISAADAVACISQQTQGLIDDIKDLPASGSTPCPYMPITVEKPAGPIKLK